MTALTQNILPAPFDQFLNNNGAPLAGGSVATFAADGITPRATYKDIAGTIPNTNPVILDAGGRAQIFGTGVYVFTVKDSLANLIYTGATQDPVNSLGATAFGLSLLQSASAGAALGLLGIAGFLSNLIPVGTVVPWAGFLGASPAINLIPFWLVCRGGAVSRTTYAALFSSIGSQWGAGDGSTTFNVPNLVGRTIFGADYGGAVLSSASIGTAAVEGVRSGDQVAQGLTIVTTITDPGHSHAEVTGAGAAGSLDTITLTNSTGNTTSNLSVNTANASSGITASSVATNVGGNKQNIPPMGVMNWLIYAGA